MERARLYRDRPRKELGIKRSKGRDQAGRRRSRICRRPQKETVRSKEKESGGVCRPKRQFQGRVHAVGTWYGQEGKVSNVCKRQCGIVVWVVPPPPSLGDPRIVGWWGRGSPVRSYQPPTPDQG